MKKTLTHHDFYKLCCFIEDHPELHQESTPSIIRAVIDGTGLQVQKDQISRAFDSIGIIRLSDPTLIEFAVRGLCIKTGLAFGELVLIGKKSHAAQAEALAKLSKTSEQPLPLGDIDAAVNGGSPEGDGI